MPQDFLLEGVCGVQIFPDRGGFDRYCTSVEPGTTQALRKV